MALSAERACLAILDGSCRTPIGAFGGALKSQSATDLGTVVIKAAVERAGVPPEAIGDVIMGCVLQAGLGMVDATFRTFGEFIGRPYDSLLTPRTQHDPELVKGDGMLQDKAAAFGRKLAEG